MSISPARIAAFDILTKIESENAFSSTLLDRAATRLDPRDASLCYEIVLGVLRSKLLLDRIIGHFTSGRKLDAEVLISLRIGQYQLKYLDRIPAYSVISDSVDLVARSGKTSAKGLVNAVLRRSAQETSEFTFKNEIERISVETSHPEWLIERWVANFSAERAEAIATTNNVQPRVAFRLTGRNAFSPEIQEAYMESPYTPGCFYAARFDDEVKRLNNERRIYIQDEGSQMVASAVSVRSAARFLDVCAAPGGKTMQIAARIDPANGLVVAGDRNHKRVIYLERNCQQYGFEEIGIAQYDAAVGLPFPEGSFDAVLVDAPCTGTGTIRHNPELRYRLRPDDIGELSAKQLSILRNASKHVNVGGVLYYSTCSLEPEENEEVVEVFLRSENEFQKVLPETGRRFLDRNGYLRTSPERDDMDGFFLAAMRRS